MQPYGLQVNGSVTENTIIVLAHAFRNDTYDYYVT